MGLELLLDPANWSVVPWYIWAVFFFVFGTVVGSFLNVCIYRLPRRLNIVWPPSHCPACNYLIPWYLNIPLVSWIVLRGRCGNCGAHISVRYFIVELLTGLVFLAVWFLYWGRAPELVLAYCVFVSGLIVASFIDAEHYIIPDEITYGGMAVGFVLSLIFPRLHGERGVTESLGHCLVGVLAGVTITYAILVLGRWAFGRYKVQVPEGKKVIFGETGIWIGEEEIPYEEVFWRGSDVIKCHARKVELVDRCYMDVLVKLSPECLEIGNDRFNPEDVPFMEVETDYLVFPREAMGLGDVKFMGAIGAFIGWKGALFSIMMGSILGGVVGLALIVARRLGWGSQLPFGPYIAMGAALWVFGGKDFLPVFWDLWR